MLQASSGTVPHVSGQTNAAGVGIMTSVLHECSPVRVCKGAAYDPVSNKNFLYTLVICTWLCHVACIHKTLGQERERTSHFTLEQFR